jgi:cell division protein FtsI (penicillin-binding protein 3)
VRGDIASTRSDPIEQGRGRLAVLAACCLVAFGAVVWRLMELSLSEPAAARQTVAVQVDAARADIVDRDGELLARDLDFTDVFLRPRLLSDRDAAARALARALPQLSAPVLARRFKNLEFAYVLRNATPREVAAIHAVGLPGVEYQSKPKRAYPKGALFGHVLGYVDIDNRGLAGMEQAREVRLRAHGHGGEPLRLSVDTEVQFAVRQELLGGIADYGAAAAVGIVLDVENGELVSLVSLPDFDPNTPTRGNEDARRNRATGSLYEMGSVFKPFTFATAFETGTLSMRDHFDARMPLKIGRRTIHDFHPKNRWLSTEEVFVHSSNIGTAQIALRTGAQAQKKYLAAFGLLARSPIELPEVEPPLVQSHWGTIECATISYGYGLSVSPLQLASGIAALVNGGSYVAPTILKREPGAAIARRSVVSRETGATILSLMRANVLDGTGKGANVEGYDVGGKTGTANKQEGGGYASGKRISSFVAVFPVTAPRFLVLVMLDEPTRVPGSQYLDPTGGATAAPLSGRIIRRIAPILGMLPAPKESGPQVADKRN